MGFEVNIPDDMFGELIRNASDETLIGIVDSVSPLLVESMRSSISSKVKHSGESNLASSVKQTKAKATKTDAIMSFVRPTGKDNQRSSDGTTRNQPIRNMEKAIYMQYGVLDEAPRPWLESAVNSVDKSIQSALKEQFENRCLK